MALLNGHERQAKTVADADGNHKKLSMWTHADSVELANGLTLEESEVYLTQAEYDALPNTKFTDNVVYNITDAGFGNTGISANGVTYDNTSGLESDDVQGAIDELKDITDGINDAISNVDNTADIDKPVSTAQQSAINTKLTADSGDTKNNVTTFTSNDTTDVSTWTDVTIVTSGEKHSSLFSKISTMFKNIRWLYKMLGSTDISAIGDGTTTGAISELNNALSNYLPLKGGSLTGNVNVAKTDSSESHFKVLNSLHNGHLCASTTGKLGIYSMTANKWLCYMESDGTAIFNGRAKSGWTTIIEGAVASDITLADLDIWNYSEFYFRFYGGSDYYFVGHMTPGNFQTFHKNRLYFNNNYGYIDVTINFWSTNKPVNTYFVASDGTTGMDNTLIKVYAR